MIPHITPLLSLGQLCDAGCIAVLTAKTISILKDENTVMRGYRDINTNLWHIPPAKPRKQEHVAKYVKHGASPSQLVSFAQATFFSPVYKTMRHAVQKHFIHSFPGLSAVTMKKYWSNTVATSHGHLDQSRSNTRSTKQKHVPPKLSMTKKLLYDHEYSNSFPDKCLTKSHVCFLT